MEFKSNPNQRRITYHKTEGATGYTKINIKAAREAMSTLSYSAFMLYGYMSLNADNYEDWFSPAILLQRTNLTESTYRKAFSELIEKGYLIQNARWKSHYDFYEGGNPVTDESKKNKTGKSEHIQRKSKPGVLKNNTDNIVNIVTPPALEERTAGEADTSMYFMDI